MTPLDTFLACACVLLVVTFAVTVAAFKRALRGSSRDVTYWYSAWAECIVDLAQANARLAPFIARRERNSDGTFKSSKAA